MIPATALALFVRFVRLNPTLSPDDPTMVAVLEAYIALEAPEALEALEAGA